MTSHNVLGTGNDNARCHYDVTVRIDHHLLNSGVHEGLKLITLQQQTNDVTHLMEPTNPCQQPHL